MSVPSKIRQAIKEELWKRARELEWNSLQLPEKARYYQLWTRDAEIGAILARYMDAGKVRVYIKDTLLKDFARSHIADARRPMRSLGIDGNYKIREEFIKPHGQLLDSGQVVSWGRAEDWKDILMATHERAFNSNSEPYAVVFLYSGGRFSELRHRRLVEDASRRLGIARVVWLE